MKLYPDCDYFHDERNDSFTPPDGECESCYRYNICKIAYDKERKEHNGPSK